MILNEIECRIRKIIEEIYCVRFCGQIVVTELTQSCGGFCIDCKETIGYKVDLYLVGDPIPKSFSTFTDDVEEFLYKIKDWLRMSRFHQSIYTDVVELYGST